MKLYAILGSYGKIVEKIELNEVPSAVNIIDITGVDLSVFTEPAYDYATQTWIEFVEPVKTIDELKNIKMNELCNYYASLFYSLEPKVKSEKESWDIQQKEWFSYTQDVNNSTPFVDAMAVGRGITRDELMTKIGNKVIGYATIQGQYQGYEDQIEAATTEAELDAISW